MQTPVTPTERRSPARSSRTASPAKPAKPAKSRQRSAKAAERAPGRRPRVASREADPVPRQGFECEGERTSGPVSPPGGIELLGSAAELLGELAKAGVSSGERLLRDVLSRLPGA